MQIDNRAQALSLLTALLIGLAAGLLYDLLRPARWHGGATRALLLDMLYCLTLGAGLFVYAMSCGGGRLGLGALALAWLGFLCYIHGFSRLFLPLFVKLFHVLELLAERIKKYRKKAADFAKKTFQKLQKCFIVRR